MSEAEAMARYLLQEGVGGVTKWWFWPNAFMRECIGLMANRVRQEMVLLVLTVIISAALSYFMIR